MLDDDAQRAAFAPDHAAGDARQWLADWRAAMVFLTRLPLSRDTSLPDAAPPVAIAGAMRAFPAAGLVVGAIIGAVLVLVTWLGAPAAVAAPLAVVAGLLITGALHEDGLADTADGFGGGATAERKLEIMRDSRIGTYGVLALIAGLALKAVAIAALAATSVWLAAAVIVAGAAMSRVAPVGLLHLLVPARRDGLSAEAGRPGRATVVQALVLATLISVVVLWPHSFFFGLVFVPLAGLAALLGMYWLARKQIDGQTGDVAGASQVVSEVVILLAAVMVLTP
jgi:adenosylcobinamide-GDP ribazoletransferase